MNHMCCGTWVSWCPYVATHSGSSTHAGRNGKPAWEIRKWEWAPQLDISNSPQGAQNSDNDITGFVTEKQEEPNLAFCKLLQLWLLWEIVASCNILDMLHTPNYKVGCLEYSEWLHLHQAFQLVCQLQMNDGMHKPNRQSMEKNLKCIFSKATYKLSMNMLVGVYFCANEH
jgi:hypothetical protein